MLEEGMYFISYTGRYSTISAFEALGNFGAFCGTI
jgi:hypothetical protein